MRQREEGKMNAGFAIGRVALVIIFIFSGVQKFLDIVGTADQIQAKIVIPPFLADVTSQIETALGLPIWQILAILVAVIEVAGGLLIAFNIIPRTAAVVLLLFTAVTTFYYHDFWNMAGAERANNLAHALKNLSIMGALLMLASWPRRVVIAEAPAGDRLEPL
jgi:putative oxidoreductase